VGERLMRRIDRRLADDLEWLADREPVERHVAADKRCGAHARQLRDLPL
jgi:hypothetical protein